MRIHATCYKFLSVVSLNNARFQFRTKLILLLTPTFSHELTFKLRHSAFGIR